MKKILLMAIFFCLVGGTVYAQQTRADKMRHRKEIRANHRGELTSIEKRKLRKDQARFKIARKRASRDGTVTPMERRRLTSIKRDQRRDSFRFRHNSRKRVI